MHTRILLLITTFFLSLSAYATTTVYTFEPTHTYAQWNVSHFGYSMLTGKFMAEGTINLDDSNIRNSRVDVIIHTREVATGIPKLDEILRSSKFFSTNSYPTAEFRSTKIVPTSKNTGLVYGILTIRNISQPAVLKMTLTKSGTHPFFGKQALGFSGVMNTKRSYFRLDAYTPGVADDVKVDIEAEALIRR